MSSAMSLGKIRKWIYFCLYYGFAKHLPISSYPLGRLGKQLRYLCCRNLFRRCGKAVNVEHGADFMFGETIEIGDRSGIGINAFIRALNSSYNKWAVKNKKPAGRLLDNKTYDQMPMK